MIDSSLVFIYTIQYFIESDGNKNIYHHNLCRRLTAEWRLLWK